MSRAVLGCLLLGCLVAGRSAGADDSLAGYRDGKLFFESADGAYLLRVHGELQARFYLGREDDEAGGQEIYDGFQMRRLKLVLVGRVASPRVGYAIFMATRRSTGDMFVDEWILTGQLSDQWRLRAGHYDVAFLRQQIVPARRQVGIERGLVTEFFTLDISDQLELRWRHRGKIAELRLSVNEGGNHEGPIASGIDTDGRKGVSLRSDYTIVGTLDDFDDHYGGVELGLRVGAAALAEDHTDPDGEVYSWTADASLKGGGWCAFAAAHGAHLHRDDGDDHAYGVQTQIDYVLFGTMWDLYGRYGFVRATSVGSNDDFRTITLGLNLRPGQHLKISTDGIWVRAPGGLPEAFPARTIDSGSFGSGVGFRGAAAHKRSLVLMRVQAQLIF